LKIKFQQLTIPVNYITSRFENTSSLFRRNYLEYKSKVNFATSFCNKTIKNTKVKFIMQRHLEEIIWNVKVKLILQRHFVIKQ
jgi:hypothetical protein